VHLPELGRIGQLVAIYLCYGLLKELAFWSQIAELLTPSEGEVEAKKPNQNTAE